MVRAHLIVLVLLGSLFACSRAGKMAGEQSTATFDSTTPEFAWHAPQRFKGVELGMAWKEVRAKVGKSSDVEALERLGRQRVRACVVDVYEIENQPGLILVGYDPGGDVSGVYWTSSKTQ